MLGLWAHLLYRDLVSPINNGDYLINEATGFIDGSDLYGNREDHGNSIKTSSGHIDINRCTICRDGSGIGAVYWLLYREHNRLVDDLRAINPTWSGDRLYKEASKIVTAEIQHITYNEFLPNILSQIESRPMLVHNGFARNYSSSVRSGTHLETALATLLLLTSITPPTLVSMTMKNGNISHEDSTMLDTLISSFTTPGQLPNLRIYGLPSGFNSALELIEIGRSEGLGSYTDFIKDCTSQSIDKFEDLTNIAKDEQLLLQNLYKSVDEIDLLVGGVLERGGAQGSLLGSTLECILSKEFLSLKQGDRFWYEYDLPPASFTKGQLHEIRRVTLSGLICENLRLQNIQPKVFVQEDPYLNAHVGCEHQSGLSVGQWREEDESKQDTIITKEMIKEAMIKAAEDLARRQRRELVVYADKGGVDPKSPLGTAAAFSKPNKMALAIANNSLLLEFASQEILSSVTAKQRRRRQLEGDNVINFDIGLNSAKELFSDLDLGELFPPLTFTRLNLNDGDIDECPNEEKGPCDPTSPYRTFTGHCNNLEHPRLGASLTTFARLLPAVYENGISNPRMTSVTGVPLPSARVVSSMIHADISYLHSRYTLMLMQFAQFVDHDITFTPNHRGFFASIPDCRSCNSPITVHPECMPIPVPPNDHFFPKRNVTTGEKFCLAFMRSLPGQQRLGPREQINQNSAYLDGSQIYGEHACLARQLRAFNLGKMNMTVTRVGKDLLPVSPVHPECKAPSGYCFIAGDGRASEQPGLTAMHTVYAREHNRLADGLKLVNPHWDDERIYQEARKIAVASYQHVMYNEFLPRILGWNAVNLYGLKLHSHGYYKGYRSSCNPTIVTEFASAAYRIGHSLLRPHIPRMTPSFTPIEPGILLRDTFFNPDIVYKPHMVDEIMRGLISTPMESLDQFITGEISNHLFEDRRIPHSGMDLPALNIQRGRDHGIPPYNEYRSLCNLKRAETWEDLSREIPQEVISRLRLIYPSVKDVDLFPGGLSERPLQGGLVGPTFACIIGLQFRQLRKCDRYWYENDDPNIRFTEPQLAEIRKSTLARLICNNLDATGDIQRSVFDQPSEFLNPRVPCRSLPSLDLNAWKETVADGCLIAGRRVRIGESAIPTPCTSCICTSEGAQCASLRVTDCPRLLSEAGRDAVLRDEVCASQCSSFLNVSPLVTLTTRRPRNRQRNSNGDFLPTSLVPPPPVKRRPTLRSFVPTVFLG
ncbi:hypothetical protein O3M35_006245 [Rhynocoris fuscipes]|uniref:Uncharacterized protein n=1 Tax=Rhynocoris fuscipes TaxID=488301 RepID=A0AAW1DDH2_9HEMI